MQLKAIIAVVLVLSALTLGFAPPPTDFEAWMVEPGYNYFKTGNMTSYIFDDILESRNGVIGQGKIFHLLEGLLFYLSDSLTVVRAAGFVFGLLTIAMVYLICKRLSGGLGAWLSVLLLISSSAYFYGTHLARASIFVAFLQTASLYFIIKLSDFENSNNLKYPFMAGMMAFSTLLFHMSGIIVVISITALFLFISRKKEYRHTYSTYILASLIVLVIWYCIEVLPTGPGFFMDKMSFMSDYSHRKISLTNSVLWKYFVISKLNVIYLASFCLASVMAIGNRKIRLPFIYMAVFAVTAILIGKEDYEPHKAVIFMPVVSIAIGLAVAGTAGSWKKGTVFARIFMVSLICAAALSILSGVFKQAIYVYRSGKVDYSVFTEKIKECVEPKLSILGQPSLWFSLRERNKLYGGTYYLSRMKYCGGPTEYRVSEEDPDITSIGSGAILQYLKAKGISYIIANSGMREFMQRNGLTRFEKSGQITRVAVIDTYFYGDENFKPGYITIYKIAR